MLFTRRENDGLNPARGIVNAVLLACYLGLLAALIFLWAW